MYATLRIVYRVFPDLVDKATEKYTSGLTINNWSELTRMNEIAEKGIKYAIKSSLYDMKEISRPVYIKPKIQLRIGCINVAQIKRHFT